MHIKELHFINFQHFSFSSPTVQQPIIWVMTVIPKSNPQYYIPTNHKYPTNKKETYRERETSTQRKA